MCHFAHFLAIKVLLFGTEGRHFLALTPFRGACATQIQMIVIDVLLLHRQVVSSPPFVPPKTRRGTPKTPKRTPTSGKPHLLLQLISVMCRVWLDKRFCYPCSGDRDTSRKAVGRCTKLEEDCRLPL